MPPGRVTLKFAEREFVVDVIDTDHVRIDGQPIRVVSSSGVMRIEAAGGGLTWAVRAVDVCWVYHDGCVYRLEIQREGARRRSAPDAGSLAAPMPATVRQVRVGVGDAVARGDTLIVLEAMKMELPVRANVDGTVSALHCREGDLVQPGRALIELAATRED